MSVKEREEREPLEEAWLEEREPREEEEDMESVEAESSLSCDSSLVTARIPSRSCWRRSCFSSWTRSLEMWERKKKLKSVVKKWNAV